MRGLALLALAAFLVAPSFADWNHPVKWNQMDALDSYGGASWIDNDTPSDAISADDFMCNESGFITDLHFAGWSIYGEIYLTGFRVQFWNNIPAGGGLESHPGDLLWSRDIYTYNTSGSAAPFLYEIDIPQADWFAQTQGNIYWVSIQGLMLNDGFFDGWYWSFRQRGLHNLDDAAFASQYFGYAPWAHWAVNPANSVVLYNGTMPPGYTSLDMAFALTGIVPEPATFGLVGLGLLLLRRR